MTEWIKCSDALPREHEFVEVSYRKKSIISEFERAYATLCNVDGKIKWITYCSDDDYKNYVKFWRYLSPDPYGRLPFLKTNKGGYFEIVLRKAKKRTIDFNNDKGHHCELDDKWICSRFRGSSKLFVGSRGSGGHFDVNFCPKCGYTSQNEKFEDSE